MPNDEKNTTGPRDDDDSNPEGFRSRRQRRRRWMMFTGLPLLALGSVFAARAFADGHGRWHHGGGHGRWHHDSASTVDEFQQRLGRRADRVLDYLDATEAQQQEIDAIIETSVPQLFALKTEGRDLRGQLFAAVKAGDRDQIERLRKAGVNHLDRASKVYIDTAQLAMDVLDEQQKSELMDKLDRFAKYFGH